MISTKALNCSFSDGSPPPIKRDAHSLWRGDSILQYCQTNVFFVAAMTTMLSGQSYGSSCRPHCQTLTRTALNFFFLLLNTLSIYQDICSFNLKRENYKLHQFLFFPRIITIIEAGRRSNTNTYSSRSCRSSHDFKHVGNLASE